MSVACAGSKWTNRLRHIIYDGDGTVVACCDYFDDDGLQQLLKTLALEQTKIVSNYALATPLRSLRYLKCCCVSYCCIQLGVNFMIRRT